MLSSHAMSHPRVLINALSMAGGGGQSYIVNLLGELDRDPRGLDFTILVQDGRLEGVDYENLTVRRIKLPDPGRILWRILYEQIALPILARRFDLLYCTADLSPIVCMTPKVVLLANLNIYDRRWYDDLRTRTLFWLVTRGLKRAKRIVFATRAAADAIRALTPIASDKIRIAPFGIDPGGLERNHSDSCDDGTPSYLFVPAAPERHKNIEVLVDALASTADGDLELWVAGRSLTDPDHVRSLQQRAARAGVAERVRFIGNVPYRELGDYYRGAVALAFPSFIETFGFPLLEAMAVGTPVLASDIAPFREIAGDAALYFPPSDPIAMARVVDELQAHPTEAEARVEVGRERAARFSWRAGVDALVSVFDDALRHSSR